MTHERYSSPCPCDNCDGSLESITDCFAGHHSALDNFDEVRDYLARHYCLSPIPPLFAEHGVDPDDPDAPDVTRDGPFITASLVVTEAWCDTCDYSQRTYSPPRDRTTPPSSLRDHSTSLSEEFDDIIEEADELLAEMDT